MADYKADILYRSRQLRALLLSCHGEGHDSFKSLFPKDRHDILSIAADLADSIVDDIPAAEDVIQKHLAHIAALLALITGDGFAHFDSLSAANFDNAIWLAFDLADSICQELRADQIPGAGADVEAER